MHLISPDLMMVHSLYTMSYTNTFFICCYFYFFLEFFFNTTFRHPSEVSCVVELSGNNYPKWSLCKGAFGTEYLSNGKENN